MKNIDTEIIRIMEKLLKYDIRKIKYSIGKAYVEGMYGVTSYYSEDVCVPDSKDLEFFEVDPCCNYLLNIKRYMVGVKIKGLDRIILIDKYSEKYKDNDKFGVFTSVYYIDEYERLKVEIMKELESNGYGWHEYTESGIIKYYVRYLRMDRLIILLRNNEEIKDLDKLKSLYYTMLKKSDSSFTKNRRKKFRKEFTYYSYP